MVSNNSTRVGNVTHSLLYQNSKNNLISPLSYLSQKPFNATILEFLDNDSAVLTDKENNKFILEQLNNNFIGEELEVEINPDMKTATIHGKNNTSSTVRVLPYKDVNVVLGKMPIDQVKLSNVNTPDSIIKGTITYLDKENPQSKLFRTNQQLEFKIIVSDENRKSQKLSNAIKNDGKELSGYNPKSQNSKTQGVSNHDVNIKLDNRLDSNVNPKKNTRTSTSFSNVKIGTNAYNKNNMNILGDDAKKNIASTSTATNPSTKNTGISSLFTQLVENFPKFSDNKDTAKVNQTFKATVVESKNDITRIKTEFGSIQINQKLELPKNISINIQQFVQVSDSEKQLLPLINNLNNNLLLLQNLTTLLATGNYEAFIKLMVHYDPAKLNKLLKKTNSVDPDKADEWIENLESGALDTTVKNTVHEISNQYLSNKELAEMPNDSQVIKLPLLLGNELYEIDTEISYDTENQSLNFTMECDLSGKFTIDGSIYFKDKYRSHVEHMNLKIISEGKLDHGLRKEISNIFNEYIEIIKIHGNISYINEME